MADKAAKDAFEDPRRQSLKNYDGLSSGNLTQEQMNLLQKLVVGFVHNAEHAAASAQMDAIRDANHDHMIIRDPSNDYGEDWLEKHFEKHHPNMKDATENVRRRAASQPSSEKK